MKKLIVGISGASGVELGIKFIQALPKEIEKYVIISEHAKVVFEKEKNIFFVNRISWHLCFEGKFATIEAFYLVFPINFRWP